MKNREAQCLALDVDRFSSSIKKTPRSGANWMRGGLLFSGRDAVAYYSVMIKELPIPARTVLVVLASIFAFDLQLAFFSGRAFFVSKSTTLTNVAIVVTIVLLGYFLGKFIGFIRTRNIKRILFCAVVATAFSLADFFLISSLLSQDRDVAVKHVTNFSRDPASFSATFSYPHIGQLWKSEAGKNLHSCVIGEVPYGRKFLFKVQGEKSSYLVVVTVGALIGVQIAPLKDEATQKCVLDSKLPANSISPSQLTFQAGA